MVRKKEINFFIIIFLFNLLIFLNKKNILFFFLIMKIIIKPEIKYYKNQKPLENFSKQFLDDFFLPNEKSLLGLDENDNYIDLIDGKIKASNIKKEKIIWKRLSEIFGEDFAIYPSKENMHLTEIKQGDLGNCYLLSSLISLLQNPNLLLNIKPLVVAFSMSCSNVLIKFLLLY